MELSREASDGRPPRREERGRVGCRCRAVRLVVWRCHEITGEQMMASRFPGRVAAVIIVPVPADGYFAGGLIPSCAAAFFYVHLGTADIMPRGVVEAEIYWDRIGTKPYF
jgi:hypothetical protein